MTGTAARDVSFARPWAMLVVGVLAQAAGTVFVSAPAFLLPLLHLHRGVPLAQAGLLVAAPTLGLVLTLVAWGALADRIGERWVIAASLAATALAALGAALAPGFLAVGGFLLLGGAASGGTNAASGRIVVGWFPARRRGLAMGVRQMAQPLGVALAALLVPAFATLGGVGAAMAACAVATGTLALASAAIVRNPPHHVRAAAAADAANPYRAGWGLWRIHAVSVLLVVPQFTVSTFGLVWLTGERHWSETAAGLLVGGSQFVGAVGRIFVGMLSDRVASRVRPLRWVACSAVVVMLALGLADVSGGWFAAAVFVCAATVTVADNGLAFTAVGEMAGAAWSGRAFGVQNTGQFLAASAVGPMVGGLIGLVGYPLAFASVAVLPALAVPLVPRRDGTAL